MAEPNDTLALLPTASGITFTFKTSVPETPSRGDVWISRTPSPVPGPRMPGDPLAPDDGPLELTLAVYPVGALGTAQAVSEAADALFQAVSRASSGRRPFSGYMWRDGLTCTYRQATVHTLNGSWVCAVLTYASQG